MVGVKELIGGGPPPNDPPPEVQMHAHEIPLDARAKGRRIISADSDLPFMTTVKQGCVVTLKRDDLRIMAEVIDAEEADYFLGQVTNMDGYLDPRMAERVHIGSYLRFQEKHIFTA